jgi:predicted MPP superfamily phosphohydrolase
MTQRSGAGSNLHWADLLFHVATGLLGLIVVLRFIWPLPWARRWKIALSAIVMVVSIHHMWSRFAFGTMFSPEVPRAVIILVNCGFGTILLLTVFQLLIDVATILVALVRRRRVVIPVGLRYAAGSLAVALAIFGVSQAIRVPPAKEVQIAIKGLPQEFEGFRVVQLTDLHLSRLFQAPWTEAVVKAANAQNPDLIVITGDLIDGTLEDRRLDVEPLKGLRAANGVYVIPGNHEYYFGYPEWMKRFEGLGMRTLANSHAVLRRGDASLVLAGVTDLAAAAHSFPAPDIGTAISGAPTGAPVILLDHQPKNARESARTGAALQLSGHTHGGLIVGFDKWFIARFNNGFVSGQYDVDGMPLYVNNGTALWLGFAIRLGKPSELTTIILRAG